MKHIPSASLVIPFALLMSLPAWAQFPALDTASSLNLDSSPAPSPNHFGLSYRLGFNVPVSFAHLGGFPALSIARYTPDGDRYNYDNGYVLPIGRGNPTPYSYYWGYDNASQVSGNSTIVMQRSSSAATASSNDHYDTPMSGFELSYNRELVHRDSWRGGLEGAFGYTYVSVHDAATQPASVTRVNDTYSFPAGNGFTVPAAPYTGRKSSPGALIVASPRSSTTDILPDGASINGTRNFNADLFSFRWGPYVEFPLNERIAFALSGGFALMYVDSEFNYHETVTIPGSGSVGHQASGSANEWLPGGYIAGRFSVALSHSWALIAGAQVEDLGRFTQTLNSKQATMDLSKSIFVTVGLSYSF